MARPAYRERGHRADVAAAPKLVACPTHGLQPVDVDHTPPLALHDHVPGSGCCTRRARCRTCNRGAGAAIAAARRRGRARRASRSW